MSKRALDRAEAQFLPFSNKFMIACLLYLLALKLLISFLMGPLGDEAYYWLWGQNPAMSYFDHPGLAGWVLGAFDAVFGTNLIGLRAASLVTAVGSAFVVWLYAKEFAPKATTQTWLFLCLMIAASPTLFVWMTLVYHDHLLIFLTLASIYLFTRYFSRTISNQEANHATLYLAAFVLGLAGLTKYSAIFLGLAVALLVLFYPKLRPLLRQAHIYFAGALSVLMQLPTLYWNLNREFASFGFHLNDRHGAHWLEQFNSDAFFNFVLVTILLFGPFLLPAFVRLFTLKAKEQTPFGEVGIWFARLVTVFSTGTFMFISFFSFTLWYWSDLSYILMLVMLPLLMMKRWLARAHIAFGLVLTTLVAANYLIVPLPNLFGGRDMEAATVHNWHVVAERVKDMESFHGTSFVATTRFQTASQLSFALDRTDITSIEIRPTQFDIWEQRDLIRGGDAIILQDEFGYLDEARRRFESIEKIDEFTIERFGYSLLTYELYLGKNYTPRATNLIVNE